MLLRLGVFLLMLSIPQFSLAEDITTGNLLPNAGDGQYYNSTQTDRVDLSKDDFTKTGDYVFFTGEFEVADEAAISYTGSLIDITTSGDTTTQAKLNNGITLKNYVDAQNCEHGTSGYSTCGYSNGDIDTWNTTLKILDSDDGVLATSTLIRNTHSGYADPCGTGSSTGGACDQQLDTLIHTGTGSNKFSWEWKGVDAYQSNSSNNTNYYGPNLLGAAVTMTYDNVVLSSTVTEEIESVGTTITEVIAELKDQKIEEITLEIETINPITEEVILQEEKIKIEELYEKIEEIQTIALLETMLSTPFEEEKKEEITTALPIETIIEEKIEEEPAPKEEIKEEVVTKEEIKEEPASTEETKVAKQEEKKEEPKQEETKQEETTEKEESEEKETAKEEATEEEKEEAEEETEIAAKEEEEEKEIESKENKIVVSIETDLGKIEKEVGKVTRADIFFSEPTNLTAYQEVAFYESKSIYSVIDPAFFQQIDLTLYSRDIYTDITLASYIQNDPIEVHKQKLIDINNRKQKILIELEALKNE